MFAGNGQRVGKIQLVPWPAGPPASFLNPMNSTKNQIPSDVNNSSTLPFSPSMTNMTAVDPRLTVRIRLTGDVLPLFDVFTLIITVLVDLARLGATERIHAYDSPVIAGSLGVAFRELMPATTHPPFFEVQWLIKTMALIPGYMIRKGVFKEASVVVDVDGVGVAGGILGDKQAEHDVTETDDCSECDVVRYAAR